jgi:radial spoke head protein 4A
MKGFTNLKEECEAKKVEVREKEREREREKRESDRKEREKQRNMDRREKDSRDRSRGPSFNTNSADPKLLYSRVFIGNLASDKLEREDLEKMFSKYGRILGITMFKGYGFVQYDSEKEARAAVAGEGGNLVKGRPIDVKIAAEGKKGGNRGGERGSGDRSFGGRRSPQRSHRGAWGEDSYGRDRSPIRDLRDPIGRDFDDPFRRRVLAGADPYFDRFNPRDPYGADPFADAYSLASRMGPAVERPPFDCEILVTSIQCRPYADLIESKLKPSGLLTHINVLPDESAVTQTVEEVAHRLIPFAVVINPQNQAHHSLTVNILHGTPQEHRNMPFEDALNLITRNFETYTQEVREKAGGVPSAGKSDPPEFIPPDQNTHYLLNLLADNRILTLEELDTVIAYLNKRRDRIVAVKGAGEPGGQQQQLQSKILNILNGGGARDPSQTLSTQYPVRGASVGPSTSTSTSINFDNPSVQKALDNLISSGPNLLRNIGAVGQGQGGATSFAESRPQAFGSGQVGMRAGSNSGVTSLMGGRSSSGLASLAQYGQF